MPTPDGSARPTSHLAVRWSDLPEGALGLCIADCDLPSHPGAARVLLRQGDMTVHGYTRADPLAARRIVDWYARRHAWDAEVDQVTTFPVGIKTAVRLALGAVGATKSLVLTPVYGGLLKVARACGEVIEVPLRRVEGRWSLDRRATEAVMRHAQPEAIILCNPQNPVGTVWTWDEIRWLAELAASAGATLISDEAHADLVHPGARHVPLGAAAGPDASWVMVHGLGKAFNVSGFPYCWTISSRDELRDALVREASLWGLHAGSTLGDALAVELLGDGEAWLDERQQALSRNIRFAQAALDRAVPGLRCDLPSAGYLLWLGVPSSSCDPAEALLEQAGVRVLSGSRFGAGFDAYVRVNVATSPELLERATQRIVTALKGEQDACARR